MKTIFIRKITVFLILTSLVFPFGISYAQMSSSLGSEGKGQALMQATKAQDAQTSLPQTQLEKSDTLKDHQAKVIQIEGEVKILKVNTENWVSAEKGMILETGDQILTGDNSHIEFSYDEFFLNIAKIEQKTKAEFRSIEPTDLYMEDGTIFSALDGLAGNKYQISTPTAVAAVRGTHLYTEAENGAFVDIAVIPDTRDHQSSVEVLLENQQLIVQEGEQLAFSNEGSQIEPVSPEIASFATATMNHVEENYQGFRQNGLEYMKEFSGDAPNLANSDDHKAIHDGNPPGGGNGPFDGVSNHFGGAAGDFKAGTSDAFLDHALGSAAPTGDAAAAMLPLSYYNATTNETYTTNYGNFSVTSGPTPGYDPSNPNYMPPGGGAYIPPGGGTYTPPGDASYMPPGGAYIPPGGTYVPPGGMYTPHGDNYIPPGGVYVPPGDTYMSPGGMYTPPGDTYMPPGGTYVPPADTYMPPVYSPETYVYTPPPDTYMPPADTYYNPQDTAQYVYIAPTTTTTATCTDEYGHSYPC